MIGIPKGYENLARCMLGDLSDQLPWWRRLLMRVWPPYRRKVLLALFTQNPNGPAYYGMPLMRDDRRY